MMNKLNISLWILVVYFLSFICYLPLLLERRGLSAAADFLFLRYFFVCIPAVAAAFLLIFERNLKTFAVRMFSQKITIKQLFMWVLFLAAGILTSGCYSLITGLNIFQNTYPSIASLFAGFVYLFITGLVEEVAWRGFLLERISSPKKNLYHIIFVGIIWTIWHMPMWIIRNSLGFEEITYLCIWTLLVSIILGTAYYQCKNILFIALLHATFNTSYIAPVPYNTIILAIIIAASALTGRRRMQNKTGPGA